MFRIARVIINFISETLAQSESEQDEGQGVETPAPSASSSSSNFKSQFHSEHNFNVTKNGVPSAYYEREEKNHTGRITHLYQDYGLIDGYIYFSRDCVPTDVCLQVNDTVEVNAVRQPRHTGWKASHITLVSDEWDSISDVYLKVGVITNLTNDGGGAINNQYSFTAKCLKDYTPWRGDKVQAKVVDNGMTQVIETVEPYPVQTYSGRVVVVGQRFCFIDGDLAFTRSCCVGSYVPTKGDLVNGTMIECDQGRRWKHRALTVQKTISDPISSRPLGAGDFFQPMQPQNFPDNKISVTGNLLFNNVILGHHSTHTIYIKNGGKDTVKLQAVKLHDPSGTQFTVSDAKLLLEGQHALSLQHGAAELSLLPGMTCYCNVTFTPRYIGEEKQEIAVFFDKTTTHISVVGICTTDVEDSHQAVAARPHQKYHQVKHNIPFTDSNQQTLPGSRPSFRRNRLPKSLPYFDVPSQLRNCILTDTKALSRNYPLLEQPLSQQNYTSKFSLLLHIEEVSAEIEIRKFDIPAAVFGRSKGYLTLEVLGLPDGQPNLMVGDKLSVSINSHMQPIKYEGYIYEIICDTVYAKFHSSFHDSYGEEECYVIFYISRVPFRRMHMAAKMITQMEWPGIFPHIVSIRSSLLSSDEGRRPPESWLFNRYLNSEQSLSVRRVLEAKCRPFPYVIFGPPGTGKTVTVVECILQVFHRVRGSRILVCTPSNSAADLIAVKLVESYDWPENNLVRLVSFRRQEESLPEEIKAYCKDGQDLALVAEHRVIVSTCSSAGMLYGLGLSTRHFTHVFVDEAGQASEPECLIPISLAAANADTCIVMAGDHKQLGAVVKSQISQTCGLSTSLLERVMQFPPYQRNEEQFQDHTGYDPNLVTKLVQNYRAHPFILSLYSQLFYDNELVVSAGAEAFSFQHSDLLLSPNKPIIFHGLHGEELREGNNPSWFNAVELVQVVKYLQALLKVSQAEKIGVITPYRKQVEKIRQLMGSVGVDPEVKVGSVEEFQGQERQVIIVSTVRSRTEGVDALGTRTAQSLGFLTNSKRFNVTVSRAQALLIVVGNPHILSQDTHWKHLIDYCVENSCYIGVPYQQDNRET